MKKLLMAMIVAFPIYSANTCIQDLYALKNVKEGFSNTSLSNLFNNCPNSQKDSLTRTLIRIGSYVKDQDSQAKIKDYITVNFGSDKVKEFDLYSRFNNTYNIDEAMGSLDEIIEYAPGLFETLIYDISDQRLDEISQIVANHSNYDNRSEILSLMLAKNIKASDKVINMLTQRGAQFTLTQKNNQTLCDAADEELQERAEFLFDDFPDQNYDTLVEELNSITDDYFMSISKLVSLNSVTCGDETLYDIYQGAKDPDYWGLDHYDFSDEDELREESKDVYTADKEFYRLGTVIEFKGESFQTQIKMSKSCSKDSYSKDRLHTNLHNEMLKIQNLFNSKRKVKFTTYKTQDNCMIGLELMLTDAPGKTIEQVLERIY